MDQKKLSLLHSLKSIWFPSRSKMGWPRRNQMCVWIIVTSFLLFLCVTLTFNGHVWKMLDVSMHLDEYDDASEGYGLRKLLEDPDARIERLRLGGLEKRLPQCIIIGVRKCGTRALLEFLDLHPNIKIADMEMHYFNKDENYENGYEWYRKYMPFSQTSDITIEKTPRYFISESAPERIFKFNSSIKLIVIFRHPTTRVISDYTQVYENKLERNKTFEPFEDIVINKRTGRVNTGYKAVRISMYYYHLTQWLLYFRRHQIHIVNGDNLIVNPLEEIKRVETFLGLEHLVTDKNVYFNETRGFYCMNSGNNQHCLGAQKGRKHPDIDPLVIRKLNNFYRPYNRKLFSMIGRKFDWDD
ncbi:Heparan sulfate glucosamine 3-O-sulfotransferase 5 [Mactra antiquata]